MHFSVKEKQGSRLRIASCYDTTARKVLARREKKPNAYSGSRIREATHSFDLTEYRLSNRIENCETRYTRGRSSPTCDPRLGFKEIFSGFASSRAHCNRAMRVLYLWRGRAATLALRGKRQPSSESTGASGVCQAVRSAGGNHTAFQVSDFPYSRVRADRNPKGNLYAAFPHSWDPDTSRWRD